MRELTARIRAVLRRSQKVGQEPDLLRVGNIILNENARRVTIDGEIIELTPTEFYILATLMTSPGRVYARLDLIDESQGAVYEGYERSIDTHIRRLRGKIEPNPKNPRYVETVYGFGYRFNDQHPTGQA